MPLTPSSLLKTGRKVRVMIVDDSAVIRSVISTILKTDEAIDIVGMASNGQQAVENVVQCNPDIIILDIEMPFMDGITALPLILKKKPDTRIIICSTLSARGADISIKALSLGATECLLKPSGADAIQERRDFHASLLRIVRTLGERLQQPAIAKPAAPAIATIQKPSAFGTPQIIAIGSSTGGPNALMALLKNLKNLPVPIVITQHMPKTFTTLLANHITQETGIPCAEGAEGMAVKPGHAYVAPGGYHMLFRKHAGQTIIHLNDGEPENFCKPAVDPMMRSLMEIYGARILSCILTGMGSDGLKGCQLLVHSGGQVIAQDEASSVVWGMPGAVANAGICSAIAPLPQLADYINKALNLRHAGSAL